ncbi:unnamed protein product [Nezara viridula]|uniref:Peptidase S1 domain-containing protein n=1 Tax=Nezara viridula TaxID=85310 RepID=A0A9P0HEL0_NEZVI|nr:unnamed protein product [Nezara viridula]
MKELICLMLICISWVTNQNLNCNCGRTNMKKFINEKVTNKNEYPWMVHLSNGCGGSIITENHVLTAAHCTDKKEPEDIQVYVRMGPRNKEKNESMIKYGVSRIHQHEEFKSDTFINDISILVISERIAFNKFIGSVCLPYTPFRHKGKLIRITGWGEIEDTGDDEVGTKYINNEECKRRWPYVQDTTQICAFTLNNNSCSGVSGGGLVYQNPDTERYTQVAVVSFAPEECGNDSKPSVNTDIFVHMDWIQHAVASGQTGAKLCKKVFRKNKKGEAGWRSGRQVKSKKKRETKDEYSSSGVNLTNTIGSKTFQKGAEIQNALNPLKIKSNENNNHAIKLYEQDRQDNGNDTDYAQNDRNYPDYELDYYGYDANLSNYDPTFSGNNPNSTGNSLTELRNDPNKKEHDPLKLGYRPIVNIQNLSRNQNYCPRYPVYPTPCPGRPGCPWNCPPLPCCCPGYYPYCHSLCPPYPPFECPINPCCCSGFYIPLHPSKHDRGCKNLMERIIGWVFE